MRFSVYRKQVHEVVPSVLPVSPPLCSCFLDGATLLEALDSHRRTCTTGTRSVRLALLLLLYRKKQVIEHKKVRTVKCRVVPVLRRRRTSCSAVPTSAKRPRVYPSLLLAPNEQGIVA